MISFTTFFTFALAASLCLGAPPLKAPNPCGFNSQGQQALTCKSSKKCAALTFGFYRKPLCIKPPTSDHVCPLFFDPVCCRIPVADYPKVKITITQTESNSCFCSIVKGETLFKGSCNQPPKKLVPSTKELNPTCCYVAEFDLTFTAANHCICTKQSGGVKVSDKLCGIKN